MRRSSGVSLLLLLALLAGLAVAALPSALLRGQVRDDNGPIAAAGVRIKGSAITDRSDELGHFHLPRRAAGRRITAWKEGYFIGGARLTEAARIFLKRLPAKDNAAYEWVDPAPHAAEIDNCANCHAEIYREWSRSGHAHSVTGKHFRNLYEGTDWHDRPNVGWGLLTQYPDGAGVCTSCHAPTAREYDLRQVQGVAAAGVHCDYCHKIESVADGPLGLSHGRFNLRLLRPAKGQIFFGALDDVDRGEDVYSPLYRDSRYCASCHEGVIFGVHVYGTFSEWQASPAARQGKQCQDCHMKPTGRMTNVAPGHGGIRRDPLTLANHRFFDHSQEAMLRRAVQVSAELERDGGEVRARIRLWTEGVGHRLPTGFVDRHLVLVIEGQSASGQRLAATAGPTLSTLAGKELDGQPGRLFARVLRDFKGNSPVPFWLASPDPPPDSRLLPGQSEQTVWRFPSTLARLRLRLLYRRFWPQVVEKKGWPDNDLVISEREWIAP